jgi:hypothetical protein
MSMKNSGDNIENRTRYYLPVCSAVPQLTASPRAPVSTGGLLNFFFADFFYKTESYSAFSPFPSVYYEKKHSSRPAIDLQPIARKCLTINHADTNHVLPPPRT